MAAGFEPLKKASGELYYCGRGNNREDCPEKSHCVVHPNDRWAVCCSDEAKKKKGAH